MTATPFRIDVLVAEDSPVVREFLVHILSGDPAIRVIGTASNGAEAVEFAQRRKPDLITMDIRMPKMDGFEATRCIMETAPTPIVIVSGHLDTKEVATTFRAMEAGALAILPRPHGPGHPEYERTATELVRTVKLMAEIKVVKRWPRAAEEWGARARREGVITSETVAVAPREVEIVAIGASTGGPPVLQTILAGLAKDFPAPVLIVQHIAPGFVHGFAEWLTQSTNFPVHVATHLDAACPGHAYVAPDGMHMGVRSGGRIALSEHAPENSLRPSVAHLFRCVAEVYGPAAIGVLLTGMGKDGAQELKLLKDRGAITIGQDEASAVVNGMPGEASKLGATMYVLPPEQIAATLSKLVNKSGV